MEPIVQYSGDPTAVHARKPVYVFDSEKIPSNHVANGFTYDGTYFYIAHHVSDTDKLEISKVDTKGNVTNVTTTITGHGNTIDCDSAYLYICDSLDGRVDVLKKSDMSFVKSFTMIPEINGFALNTITPIDSNITVDGTVVTSLNIVAALESNNNQAIFGYRDSKNVFRYIGRMDLVGDNQYTQGIAATVNCLYVAYAYGVDPTGYYSLPSIIAYSWSGNILNRVFLDLTYFTRKNDYELEDIYRDSTNNRIYFVTGSGRIGYVDTARFTTNQSVHHFGHSCFKNLAWFNGVLSKNDDSNIVYKSGTTLAATIYTNPFLTPFQGQWKGVGLIAGFCAYFESRNYELFGFAVASENKNVKIASVIYSISYGTLTYKKGVVETYEGETFTLEEYSVAHPTFRTVINELHFAKDSLPYNTIDLVTI